MTPGPLPLLSRPERLPEPAASSPFVFEQAARRPRVTESQLRGAQRALVEQRRRKLEAMTLYRPLPEQLRFHQSQAVERVCCGSNRAGKTQLGAYEVACTAVGVHPYRKVPVGKAVIYVVGEDEKHIREVMWKKLARPGAFKVIRDESTREWRPVVPDAPYDAANREKWKEAAPFLPERFISKISWWKKNEDIPSLVTLKNGTQVSFWPSGATPQQGSTIDLWWADEELVRHTWINELRARCTDKLGGGFYTFSPTASTPEAYQLWTEATDPKRDFGLIDHFFLHIKENVYLPEEGKRRFKAQLKTARAYKIRWEGKFETIDSVVYPEFNDDLHLIDSAEIPADWNRWVVIDPGVQVCGVLFVAVPPAVKVEANGDTKPHPNAGEVHFYDELYIERCSAGIMAREVKRKLGKLASGGCVGFVIDDHGSRPTSHETNQKTVRELYSEALEAEGVYSALTGSEFVVGSDDIAGREECLRRMLEVSHKTGRPRLRVHGRCANFCWEMRQQFYKRNPGDKTISDKRDKKHNHLVDCSEYFAELDPDWQPPPKPDEAEDPIVKAAREWGGGPKRRQIVLGPKP